MDLSGNLTEMEKSGESITGPSKSPAPPSPTKAGIQSELDLTRHMDQKQVELSDFLEKDDRADLLHTDEADMFSFSPAKSASSSTKIPEGGGFAGDISGHDEIFRVETTTSGPTGKAEPAGGDSTFPNIKQEPADSHLENMGYFERVSPNMMDFGYDSYSTTSQSRNESTTKQQEISSYQEVHEYHSGESFGSIGRDSHGDPFHVSGQGIGDQIVPPHITGMTTSLDEIQAPNFYESEDSSSNKTDFPGDDVQKKMSESLLDDEFPIDSVGSGSPSKFSSSIESQPFAKSSPKPMEDSFYNINDEPLSSIESPFSQEAPGKRSLTPEEMSFEPMSKKSSEEIKVSSSPHQEPWVKVTSSHEPEFVENQELPGYQLEDIIEQKINQEHAEISAFQDFLSQGAADEFDRSNSASPNSVNSQPFSSKLEFAKEKVEFYTEEPVHSFGDSSIGGKKSQQEELFDLHAESKMDVPPPIPPHSREVEQEILSKTIAKGATESKSSSEFDRSGDVPQIQVCPGPPPSKPELQEFKETAKKVESFDDLAEFLPKGSFETIPTEYIPPVTPAPATKSASPAKKEETKPSDIPKPAETKKTEVTAPKKVSASYNQLELSLESQQILNTFNPKAWFDPNKLHPVVSELVYWRDPKKSGAVFGAIFVVLIALTFLSFISVVAYTSLAVLSATFAFRIYKNVLQAINKTQDGHPFKEYLELDLTLQGDKSQEICQAVINYANQTVNKLRHLFLVEDLVDSAKFAGLLYVLTYVGSCFNGLTLIILGFVAIFALPKVYESNKTVIDMYVDLASAKYQEISTKVTDALPFGKKEKAQ